MMMQVQPATAAEKLMIWRTIVGVIMVKAKLIERTKAAERLVPLRMHLKSAEKPEQKRPL